MSWSVKPFFFCFANLFSSLLLPSSVYSVSPNSSFSARVCACVGVLVAYVCTPKMSENKLWDLFCELVCFFGIVISAIVVIGRLVSDLGAHLHAAYLMPVMLSIYICGCGTHTFTHGNNEVRGRCLPAAHTPSNGALWALFFMWLVSMRYNNINNERNYIVCIAYGCANSVAGCRAIVTVAVTTAVLLYWLPCHWPLLHCPPLSELIWQNVHKRWRWRERVIERQLSYTQYLCIISRLFSFYA